MAYCHLFVALAVACASLCPPAVAEAGCSGGSCERVAVRQHYYRAPAEKIVVERIVRPVVVEEYVDVVEQRVVERQRNVDYDVQAIRKEKVVVERNRQGLLDRLRNRQRSVERSVKRESVRSY